MRSGWPAPRCPSWRAKAGLPGLHAPVTVVRDASAIPHVAAQSEADAYLALGFLHGQDRLWQMEFDRLAGQGRLAEVLGAAALPHDRFMRTLGLAGSAERAAAGLDAGHAGAARGLCRRRQRRDRELRLRPAAGVPDPAPPPGALAAGRQPAVLEADGARPVGQLARRSCCGLDWPRRLRPDQLALLWPGHGQPGPVTMAALAGLPLERLAAALPDPPPPGIGSNVWVAAGARTASGRPLLANDPHLGLQMPGQWYLAHLEAPGLAVIGATLPGVPFVVLGRNRVLAWGFTNTGSDTQDLFVERLDPADPGRYLTPGRQRAVPACGRRRSRCAAGRPSTWRCARHGMGR